MKRRLSLSALALALVAGAADASTWVQWKTSDGGNGHYYLPVLDLGANWDDARISSSTVTRNSYLATSTSAAENDFIFALIDSPEFWVTSGNNVIGPWLGGFQASKADEPAGNWQWVTGEAFTYTNWAVGQPNNLGNVQDYLHFWTAAPALRAATWDDVDLFEGGLTRGYVVESEVNPIPLPASGLLLLAGLGAFAVLRRDSKASA